MFKNLKKGKFAFGLLAIAFGLSMIATHAQAVNTVVNLSVNAGGLTLGATGAFTFPAITVSSTTTGIQKQFTGADYFFVDDLKGVNSGWYTTISVTDLTGTAGTIGSGNIAIKVPTTGTTLITGLANANVVVSNTLINYTNFGGAPLTFIKRDNAANLGKVGKYAAFPWLQVTVPAYQAVGSYQATITYTIIEN